MKPHEPIGAVSPHLLTRALADLKFRLQRIYEDAYPELREIIHLVLNEEEEVASRLSAFPHLLLPDLVEAHIARLNLVPPQEAHTVTEAPSYPIPNLIPQLAFA